MERLIEILTLVWNNLPKITPLIIGLGVIYIAWQQHKTNKDRLRMELFDRRYKIYEAMTELIATELITTDVMRKYHVKTAQAKFILGEDIYNALYKVSVTGHEIAKRVYEYQIRGVAELRGTSGFTELYEKHIEAAEEATVIFVKYFENKYTPFYLNKK